jgi:flagellar protein FlgJ
METGALTLGSAYLDNLRPSSASTVHNTENFAEVLRRTSEYKNEDSTVRPRSAQEPIDKTDRLYELCLELETFLVKNLLNSMRNSVQKSGLIDDSFAGKMYEDMLYDEYAKDLTKNANFGLAEQAYRQLKNM